MLKVPFSHYRTNRCAPAVKHSKRCLQDEDAGSLTALTSAVHPGLVVSLHSPFNTSGAAAYRACMGTLLGGALGLHTLFPFGRKEKLGSSVTSPKDSAYPHCSELAQEPGLCSNTIQTLCTPLLPQEGGGLWSEAIPKKFSMPAAGVGDG